MKFKVGDRVRVYGATVSRGNNVSGLSGEVSRTSVDNFIWVELKTTNGVEVYQVHSKQCRRLVKKKKPRTVTMWAPVVRYHSGDVLFRVDLTNEKEAALKHITAGDVLGVVAVEVELKDG